MSVSRLRAALQRAREWEPPGTPTRRRRRPAGPFAALAAAALLLSGAVSALPGAEAHAAATFNSGDVTANLWEWNWPSVASECTSVLGPNGYGAVEVAPPEESLKQTNYYWWDVYQPYSYSLNSRFGTAAQFASMVSTCHSAGVKVIVDAVINHTAAQTGTGYNGTTMSDKYNNAIYSSSDYHHIGDDCPSSDGQIDDWSSLTQIQECELLGLPDLYTQKDSVRTKIAGYLNSLLADGVDGFRVDAAKHIADADIAAIEAKLTKTTSGGAPFVTQEVVPGQTPSEASYEGTGHLLEFNYAYQLKSAFNGSVSSLSNLGTGSGLIDPAYATTFVNNHDTERNGSTLSYKDGDTYRLANIFQLAYGYGSPQVYSGFTFTGNDQAPPNSSGFVTNTDCSNGWYCTDRDSAIESMVGFHNTAGSAPVANWQSKDGNNIGFSRGSTGFVALNNSSGSTTYTYTTGLPDGSYCDLIDSCATKVTVSGGSASVTLAAKSAVAIDTGVYTPPSGPGSGGGGSTVSATFDEQASTTSGTNVYVVGSIPALGSWNTANAIRLSSSGYPIWSTTVSLPQNTSFTYKYFKEDSSGTITWESNADRPVSTGTAPAEFDNSWNVANADATDVTFNEYATTSWGTNVYVVGSIPSLGSWNASDAIPLSSASYPTWGRLVIVPKNTSFTYKYVKKDSSGTVTWESDPNRSFSTGSSSGYSTNDSWR